jgi:carbon starvation protein CstA
VNVSSRSDVTSARGAPAVRAGRLLFAGFDIAAICVAITDTTGSLANFFSFFTIESNLLAIVVLLIGGVLDPRGARWAWLRGAATLYMVITGIVYAALLANAEVGLTAAVVRCRRRSGWWCRRDRRGWSSA